MNDSRNHHILRGVFAGVAGGLAASWVMNQFMEGPGQKLQSSLQSEQERKQQEIQQRESQQRGEVKEDATMKAADALVKTATGGRHLTLKGKQVGGPIVHYAFGALMGGVYGALAECTGQATRGFGTAFGAALFVGADVVAVPAFHLSEPSSVQKPATLVNPLAAHLVYGATTELVRRAVRAVC
jgi:hypothetical protein